MHQGEQMKYLKNLHFGKTLLTAILLGLVVVPGIALARQGADDPVGHVRQEDRQADRQQNNAVASQSDDSSSSSSSSNESFVNGIKVENQVTPPAGSITMDAARAIAQGQRPGSTINKVETENEHGAAVYSFRFSDGGRVDVRASDGEVTRVEGANSSGSGSSNTLSNDDSDDDSDDSDDDDDEDEDNSGHGSNDD
jgi:Peptidase propeptide and YPEB domain